MLLAWLHFSQRLGGILLVAANVAWSRRPQAKIKSRHQMSEFLFHFQNRTFQFSSTDAIRFHAAPSGDTKGFIQLKYAAVLAITF